MSTAPAWLVEGQVGLCPCGCIGRRKKGSFLDKTLAGASRLLREAMFAEDVAVQRGLLQRIDPRVKVVGAVALLVATALVHHLPVLVGCYLGTLALAAASGLSIGFFVKRVWLFIPIFTGIVVLPATLSFITPGHVVIPLGTWFGHHVGVTRQGLTGAGIIVVRVATSISVVVLLTLTTAWTRLLSALRSLLVPRLFVAVLAMTYRYLFHLLNAVTDMYTARKARTVGADDVAGGRRFVSASAGAIFGKAIALSDEVHMAMISRGYRGEMPRARRRPLAGVDGVALLVALALAVLVVGVDRVV
jgi:cobalt/nickel transport system permease protein